jgi:hypothetical protein
MALMRSGSMVGDRLKNQRSIAQPPVPAEQPVSGQGFPVLDRELQPTRPAVVVDAEAICRP